MSDFQAWFHSMPFFTRYWLALTVVFSLIGRFQIMSPYTLILSYEPLTRFQIWRLFTCIFYYPLSPATGFSFLINIFFIYNYSNKLETETFGSRPADYAFMLLFNWIMCVICGLILNVYLLMDPMVQSVLYVWCQLNKDVIVNFWFGTRFKAMYLPWVLLAFNIVVNKGGIVEFVGIFVGHLYFFLKFKYPQELGGPELLDTPKMLKDLFPGQVGGVHGFGVPPAAPAASAPSAPAQGLFRRHNWGRGNVLGN